MMFKNKFILISLTFFFSCTSNKLIYNKYESKKGNYFNISIEENNMFQYSSVQGLISSTSKGTWIKKNDTLILNSFEKYKTNYIEIVKQKIINNTLNSVKIVDNMGNPVENRILYFNNNFNIEYKTDVYGYVKYQEQIKVLDVLTFSDIYKVELENYDYYDLIVKVVPENTQYSYFKNKKFKIRGSKLIEIETNRIYKRE
jgi:hypothetical protein